MHRLVAWCPVRWLGPWCLSVWAWGLPSWSPANAWVFDPLVAFVQVPCLAMRGWQTLSTILAISSRAWSLPCALGGRTPRVTQWPLRALEVSCSGRGSSTMRSPFGVGEVDLGAVFTCGRLPGACVTLTTRDSLGGGLSSVSSSLSLCNVSDTFPSSSLLLCNESDTFPSSWWTTTSGKESSISVSWNAHPDASSALWAIVMGNKLPDVCNKSSNLQTRPFVARAKANMAHYRPTRAEARDRVSHRHVTSNSSVAPSSGDKLYHIWLVLRNEITVKDMGNINKRSLTKVLLPVSFGSSIWIFLNGHSVFSCLCASRVWSLFLKGINLKYSICEVAFEVAAN